MKPSHKIQHLILILAAAFNEEVQKLPDVVTVGDIQTLFAAEQEERPDTMYEATEEFRTSGKPTPEISTEYSRHYEATAVCEQYVDGSYVGWTYWHGGGKHGEPEAIEWIEDAYDLTILDTKTVEVHTFEKI